MKRAAIIVGILTIAVWASAQTAGQSTQPAGAQTTPATGAATPPVGKRPPQAKTQPEFDLWKAASAGTDPAALEKGAEDFAAKYPDSELRVLLYKNAMRQYQTANNAEKTEGMGRKLLAIDGDDPEALSTVAEVIAEKTHDSDLDKDQRFDEAIKMAQKATQTVETDLNVPAGTPQANVDAYKAFLLSTAYSAIGTIEFKKENFVAAQGDLQKSIDVFPSNPDPVVVLRLALALDKQDKYPDALKVANKAVELTKDGTAVGTAARREQDRLQKLSQVSTPAPAPAASQPPKN